MADQAVRVLLLASCQQKHQHIADAWVFVCSACCTSSTGRSTLCGMSDICLVHTLCCLGVLELAMRLPDNKRLQRRFKSDSQVSGIAAFLISSGLDMKQHVIMRSFPRKVMR